MKRYGIIGYPLGHSFSHAYFTRKFEQEGLKDHLFEVFPIPTIESLPELIASHPDLLGLSVTIPYKEKVLSYLNKKSPVVQETGACNSIRIRSGELTGYNTDVIGFRHSLTTSFPVLPDKALILGTGGASKAVAYVLQELGLSFQFVSRKPSAKSLSYEQVTESVIRNHLLIVNTTPLGMFPQVVEAPQIPYQAIGKTHCLFDLIYNPAQTLFLQKGAEQGAAIKNGLEMLELQASESWKRWNE